MTQLQAGTLAPGDLVTVRAVPGHKVTVGLWPPKYGYPRIGTLVFGDLLIILEHSGGEVLVVTRFGLGWVADVSLLETLA